MLVRSLDHLPRLFFFLRARSIKDIIIFNLSYPILSYTILT